MAALACYAQDAGPDRSALQKDLEPSLRFEAPVAGTIPGGWGGGPSGTIFADDKIVHGGKGSARIERNAASANDFSSITKSIPIDFAGSEIELRGYLRTEDVSGFAGLWMREDGERPALAFDNMQSRALKGTTDWTTYSIKLRVVPEATQLFIGVLVVGTGKAWADDLELLVDGRPVWELPRTKHPETVMDRDHQFDGGSGIVIHSLSAVQVENLTILGKVWGFLKYHHPLITSGQRHWDYDLLRVLPAVLNAPDRPASDSIISHWIDNLGPVDLCKPCAKLDEMDLSFRPDLDWIVDEKLLDADLSQKLHSIRDNRTPGRQFYVSKAENVGNPVFNHELAYASTKFPDSGFQILALYRFWNIVEYWSPYRDIIGDDWNRVLSEFIPRFALADSLDSYKRELMAFVAKLHDGHANIWNALDARPPVGKCHVPVSVHFVDSLPVITGIPANAGEGTTQLKVGDVITEIDGVAVGKLIDDWTPYYATSNAAARVRDIGHYMLRGKCGDAKIGIRRDKKDLTFSVPRKPSTINDFDPGKHDMPGPAFRLLSKDVAYLKLSAVKETDCAKYVQDAAGTRGFIVDIRNYPSEFVVFALGSLFVEKKTPFALFTEGDLSNPGAFHWGTTESLSPEKPHYSGKIVILVDEASMSQAEYTSMAFQVAPVAIVVGSATSGADGNVSPFQLPGGLNTMISGIGVFYPDKTPTQRIGIVPNVEMKPTLAGIRDGRDEVLEEALRQILGSRVAASDIERMARHE
jgi:C-terminal processing protease CtpA/Prc